MKKASERRKSRCAENDGWTEEVGVKEALARQVVERTVKLMVVKFVAAQHQALI